MIVEMIGMYTDLQSQRVERDSVEMMMGGWSAGVRTHQLASCSTARPERRPEVPKRSLLILSSGSSASSFNHQCAVAPSHPGRAPPRPLAPPLASAMTSCPKHGQRATPCTQRKNNTATACPMQYLMHKRESNETIGYTHIRRPVCMSEC